MHTLRKEGHIPGGTNVLSKPMAEARNKHPVPRQTASWDTVGTRGGKSPGPHGRLRSGHVFQKPMRFTSIGVPWDSSVLLLFLLLLLNSNRYG